MSDDIKLPEPFGWVWQHPTCKTAPANFVRQDQTKYMPYLGSGSDDERMERGGFKKVFTADQLRAAVLADREDRASAAEQVCAEVYQVVGSMLEDLGQFGSGRSWKVLDNLSQAKKVHDDVLPWPSFKAKT